MKKIFFLAVTLFLFGQLVLADPDIPTETIWADLDYLDTTGQTKDLLPTYPIPYSAKWAEGEYGRIFSMSAEDVDSEFSYAIETFGVEEEGTYAWDYTEVAASDLPRGATYKLSYKIQNTSAVIFDEQLSVASVTLLPEPCAALVLALLGLVIFRRK